MVRTEANHDGEKDRVSHVAPYMPYPPVEENGSIPGVLEERIESLREAIEEIDEALAARRELNRRFVEQIDREAEEVKRHLDMLPAPWMTGFQPEQRFLRLSFQRRVKSD